jgi:hypothetical protein
MAGRPLTSACRAARGRRRFEPGRARRESACKAAPVLDEFAAFVHGAFPRQDHGRGRMLSGRRGRRSARGGPPSSSPIPIVKSSRGPCPRWPTTTTSAPRCFAVATITNPGSPWPSRASASGPRSARTASASSRSARRRVTSDGDLVVVGVHVAPRQRRRVDDQALEMRMYRRSDQARARWKPRLSRAEAVVAVPAAQGEASTPPGYAPAAKDRSGSVVARASRRSGAAELLEATTLPLCVTDGVPLTPSE